MIAQWLHWITPLLTFAIAPVARAVLLGRGNFYCDPLFLIHKPPGE
ncbi:MAG: hypothetical protein ACREDM_07850 [Methylocella sp.]